jgi:hypothetical protein
VPVEPPEERRPTYLAGPFAALGHTFTVTTFDVELHRYLAAAFAGLATAARPEHRYDLSERPSAEGPIYELRRDGIAVHRTHRPETTIGALSWNINRAAFQSRRDLVLVHAAVASRDGQALLLPAVMEAGKTTLVAGLVRRGLGYLSDEMAAVEPGTLTVHPYAKPLSVDAGSWTVLPSLAPLVGETVAPYTQLQWQVGAQTIRPDALAGPATPRWIIAPRYEPGAPTRVERVRPAEMVLLLAQQAFALDADVLRTIAELVKATSCHRLVSGDLASACDAVLQLLDER